MGHKGPLTVVSPSEWRDRTSLRLSSRSATTKSVDAAYEAWYQNTRDPVRGKALYEALTAYVREKGGDWRRADRDVVSGGLMKYVHDLLRNAYAPPTSPAQRAIATTDVPHSRYGVLYLFGNIAIDMNKLSIALEGVSAIGGAVGSGFATNFNHLDSAKLAEKTFDMGQLKEIGSGGVISGGQFALNTAGGVAASTGTKRPTDERFGAVKNPFHRDGSGNPKYLKVYWEQPAPRRELPGWPTTMAAFEMVKEDPALMLNPYTIAGTALIHTGAVLYDALNNLRVVLINAVSDLFNWIKSKLLNDGEWGWTVSGKLVANIIKFVVGKCLESAAPLVGAAMDLGGGIMQTIKAAKERIGTWWLRRKININPGHPELLANAIEANMSKGIFAGLWSVLKGVASTALAVFLPGAGSLVSALVTGIEWMFKFIWRIVEQSRINKWLEEARGHFLNERRLALEKTLAMRSADPEFASKFTSGKDKSGNILGGRVQLHPETDRSKGGIITDLKRFKAFYEKGCDASPLIPMLTLNSGICGSLMVLLKMFEDSGDRITQQTFDAGNEYFTKLKQYGRGYLAGAGFEFKPVDGSDKAVQGILNHAVQHHTGGTSKLDKVLAFGASFAS